MAVDDRLILSDKYQSFLRCNAPVEFLEGTTAAGKTTVGLFKFMLRVAESPKKIHILAGLDLGTIEKNIINKDLGILDDFGSLVEYNAGGKGKNSLPHLLFHPSSGDKVIYVLGYDNKAAGKRHWAASTDACILTRSILRTWSLYAKRRCAVITCSPR